MQSLIRFICELSLYFCGYDILGLYRLQPVLMKYEADLNGKVFLAEGIFFGIKYCCVIYVSLLW